MEAFFQDLGRKIHARWKRENFSLAAFPGIAQALLDARPPAKHVDLTQFLQSFLLNDEQAFQTQSGFGQPEIVAYDHPRFYIQMLFWMDGTTAIHQHEFSGAFHVMTGSSIHALYEFENATSITPYFRVGSVRMKQIELLETGRTVPIVSGRDCVHSLFHLDSPSVTVVVRTQNDPGTGPQFNYLPPHVAIDPAHEDALMMRRLQLLDLMAQIQDPDYFPMLRKLVVSSDFQSGFQFLQSCRADLLAMGKWSALLRAFEKKHGDLAMGIGATLEEEARRETIKAMRGMITDPEHRYFLALLMNVDRLESLLDLVQARFSEDAPTETMLRWLQELMDWGDAGVMILDATFPEDLRIPLEEQGEFFLAVIRQGLLEPDGSIEPQIFDQVQSALRQTTLRILTNPN